MCQAGLVSRPASEAVLCMHGCADDKLHWAVSASDNSIHAGRARQKDSMMESLKNTICMGLFVNVDKRLAPQR